MFKNEFIQTRKLRSFMSRYGEDIANERSKSRQPVLNLKIKWEIY